MINVTTATIAELVAFYNSHAETPVKRFADRKTAERRVQALIDAMPAPAPVAPAIPAAAFKAIAYVPSMGCPKCRNGRECGDITANGFEGTRGGDEQLLCHACGTAWEAETGKIVRSMHAPVNAASQANRSAAIAATWANPEVAAKHQERTAVRVMKKGGESEEWFKSTAAAFRALRLPLQGHIKFRMALKAAGQLEFTNGKDVWVFTTDDGNGNMVAKPGRVPAKVSKRKTLGAELAQVAAKSPK